MARKSPRSRRRPPAASSLPKSRRSRATPGRARAARSRTGAARHAKGAAPRRTATVKARPRPRTTKPRATARRRRFTPPTPERVAAILATLERLYPEATTALDFGTPLQLLIATILSAQCTDDRVNRVTPALFARYPDAAAFAAARREDLEALIRPTGFFRNKARSLLGLGQALVARHGGRVPDTMEELVELPGVGRKTANVVLGTWFGKPAIPVDTHVTRLSGRLELTEETDPVGIEQDLMQLFPPSEWTFSSHALIWHGRQVCKALRPQCPACGLRKDCPWPDRTRA